MELIMIYQKTVPEPVFQLVVSVMSLEVIYSEMDLRKLKVTKMVLTTCFVCLFVISFFSNKNVKTNSMNNSHPRKPTPN
jgi:hypothetical protein